MNLIICFFLQHYRQICWKRRKERIQGEDVLRAGFQGEYLDI
jgi:hypothetical protein